MSTKALNKDTTYQPIIIAVLFGIIILSIAGFATSAHDTAHDMRHAIGFACH